MEFFDTLDTVVVEGGVLTIQPSRDRTAWCFQPCTHRLEGLAVQASDTPVVQL